MQFIDEAIIHVKAGDGGDGSAAMMREAHVPHGGPSGGDGGNGGSIVIVVDPNISSLLDFKYKRHYKAEAGEPGRNRDQYGAAADDLVIRVPVGTVINDARDRRADRRSVRARRRASCSPRAGSAAAATCTSRRPGTRRRPSASRGRPGSSARSGSSSSCSPTSGCSGYPNVGKSTFISAVSRARPKVADYPFTTLVPNLGVVQLSDERNFVIADIPGLIEGAADGAGLGHQFLRHVERCRVLLHILDDTFTTGPDRSPVEDFRVINAELARYAPELANTPQVVVLNKVDATDPDAIEAHRRAFADFGIELLTMSAATGEGTTPVLERLWSHLQAARAG